MVYEFELGQNAVEISKNIGCVRHKNEVDHSTVTRWLKKFRSGCKNLDNQMRSGRSKCVDSEIVLQAIEANLASSTQTVWGELCISYSSVVHHFYDLGIQSCRIVHHVTKMLKNFWLFKKFTFINDRLAIKINRCLQEADVLEGWTQERLHWSKKTRQKWTASPQTIANA